MRKKIAIRVELRDFKCGPYQCSPSSKIPKMAEEQNGDVNHPVACTWVEDHWRFGFSSPDKCKKWFSRYHRKLQRAGFVYSIYIVDNYNFEDEFQIAFTPVGDPIKQCKTLAELFRVYKTVKKDDKHEQRQNPKVSPTIQAPL